MTERKEMLSIWVWVGLVLGVYGFLVTGMGIYYVFRPETLTATHDLNPSLWWGAVMTVTGIVFFLLGLHGSAES